MGRARPWCGMGTATRLGWRDGGTLGVFAFGFAYWFGFVLVLEPGNVLRADQAPLLGQEILRLTGAGLLGAAITPLVFALARRFPAEGPGDGRRILLHLGAAFAIAAWLIVASTVLAVLFLSEERRPLGAALLGQFAANGLLLFFFVVLLSAIAHGFHYFRRYGEAAALPESAERFLQSVAVKDRERTLIVAMTDVGWIEAQGNYVALHAGGRAHLIRETLTAFERRLDPARFARIHRRTIVALPRVKSIAPLPGGDATVTLEDGAEIRMSRSYREAVRAKLTTT